MNRSAYEPEASALRVGLVMQSLRTGGLEALVMRLAFALQQRGHHPEVIALEEGELRQPLEQAGVPVHCVDKPEGYHPGCSWQLRGLFRRRRLERIHTHHIGPLVYALPAALSAGIPVVHTVHSNEHLGRESTWHRKMFRAFSRGCSRITTVSEELSHFLRAELSIPAAQLTSIRNGVDGAQFHGDYPRSKLRAQLGVGEQQEVLGVVARLQPEKGHGILLEAMAQLPATLRPRLLLVGDGSCKAELVQRAQRLGLEQQLTCLGNRRDIPQLLSVMDVFVLPSLREGLPLAMLEAMSSGLPVIGTAVGGVPRLLRDSGGGICVAPGDPKALAAALCEMLEDPQERNHMASRGQQWVRDHYSQHAMIDAYLQALVDARPAPLSRSLGGLALGLSEMAWQRALAR